MNMFYDIIIGEKTWTSYSAMKVFKDTLKNIYVAGNKDFYIVEMSVLNQRMIVCRNTEEGKAIENYLNDLELKEQDLQNYIDEIGLKNIGIQALQVLIEEVKKEAFKAGKRQAKREIKKALFEEEY